MYESFNQVTLTKANQVKVDEYYNQGYVFTRIGKGEMQQIKSVRIKLADFELSSENRRVLKKSENLSINYNVIPSMSYSWKIGKLAKDFYEKKFGSNIMSANKIKEMFNDPAKSNMNAFFEYAIDGQSIGYCLLHETDNILHYSYPFYNLDVEQTNLGITMMLKAVIWSQEKGKQYIYLGNDNKYKHQFKGLEVFNPDTKSWK